MKVVLFFLLGVVATGYASYCDHTSDCTLVACNPGFDLTCYRDNVCTCVANYRTFNCTAQDECDHVFGYCRHGDHHWHCVDNHCVCRSYYSGSG